jgi:hypothetical protein
MGMSAERTAYRQDTNRRKAVAAAITRARFALHQLSAELHGNGGTTNELRHITTALEELDLLEREWAW